MRYQKIESRIWHDPKFLKLKPMVQRIFIYILTCPHGNLIGLFVLKVGYACEDLRCLPKDFLKGCQSLIDEGLIEYDKSLSVVFIKNFLKHNPITNPNQVIAAKKILSELPKTYLLMKLKGLVKGLSDEFIEGLSKGLPKPETDSETEEETEEDTHTENPSPETGEHVTHFVDLWNQKAPKEMPRVREISGKRERAIKSALKKHDLEYWGNLFLTLADYPFLLGDGDRRWVADIDFVLRNWEKISEGSYKKGDYRQDGWISRWAEKGDSE